MFVFLSSDANKNFFAGNSHTSFRVKLPSSIRLAPSGEWAVALVDVCVPKFAEGYETDFITCQPSIVNSSLASILHRFYFKKIKHGGAVTIDRPRYVTVNTDSFDHLYIYLSDSNGAEPSFSNGDLYCTLHFLRRG